MNDIQRALLKLNKLGNLKRSEDREIERLTTAARGLGGTVAGGSRGGASDRMADSAARLAQYKEYVKGERRTRNRERTEALKAVWCGLDAEAADVAIMIALDHMDEEEIAEATGKSVRWVYLMMDKIERCM